MSPPRKNILLTGPPGIGKTTACRKIADHLTSSGGPVHGFYTEEIRESGRRKGFRIVTLGGRTGILAHADHRGRHRVGRYGVNLEDLETIALPEIIPRGEPGEIILVDEVGTMELKSSRFRDTLVRALDSSARVLATIKLGGHPLIGQVKSRRDAETLEVTAGNRDEIPGIILGMLREKRSWAGT